MILVRRSIYFANQWAPLVRTLPASRVDPSRHHHALNLLSSPPTEVLGASPYFGDGERRAPMNLEMANLLTTTFFKLASLVAGVALCSMGYRLFLAGTDTDLLGNRPVWLRALRYLSKNVLPGLLFAAAGAAVLAVTLDRALLPAFQANQERSLHTPGHSGPTEKNP